MTREIKFRAWDDKDKKWLMGYEYPSLGGFSMFGECMLFGEWEKVLNSRPLQELNTIKLMQSTGLKDKNGVLIYEGDIVKGRTTYHEERISEVEWDNQITGFIPFNGYDSDCQEYYEIGSCEIIGNIWENQELLDNKQL